MDLFHKYCTNAPNAPMHQCTRLWCTQVGAFHKQIPLKKHILWTYCTWYNPPFVNFWSPMSYYFLSYVCVTRCVTSCTASCTTRCMYLRMYLKDTLNFIETWKYFLITSSLSISNLNQHSHVDQAGGRLA